MVFSAFAGVGKTSIVLAALKRGFEINGDDLVIVGDGFVFPYPQDLSVYAYHTQILEILPNVYGRRLRRAGKVHSFLEKLPRRNLFMRVLRVLLSRLYRSQPMCLPVWRIVSNLQQRKLSRKRSSLCQEVRR